MSTCTAVRHFVATLYLEAEYYDAPEDLVTDLAVKAGELRNDIRHVTRKLLTGLRGSIDELDRYYIPDEARAAKRLLRELAIADGPVPKTNLQAIYHEELGGADGQKFDLLLSWLHDDFYVEERGPARQREILFQSKWLRDWWRIYHASI